MRTPRSSYAGIFLLAAAILLFEITLTRVFAIMMWHHFTYMVVSIALLGFGAAGSWLTARRAVERHDDPTGGIAVLATGFGLSAMAAFAFVTKVEIDTLRLREDWSNLVSLLLIYLIISAPMLIGGLAIGTALTRRAADVNRLYFADLAGSALGGAASVWLLESIGATATIIAAGALGTIAGFVFSFAAPLRHRAATLLGAGVASLALVGILGGAPSIGIPSFGWKIPDAPGKELASLAGGMTEKRLPSATAEVEVSPSFEADPMIGGNFSRTNRVRVPARFVTQDGTAPTMMYADAVDLTRFPFLRESQAATAYVCRESSGRKSPNVLVIGVGGGVDVMLALAFDARQVTAVEINNAMIRMVTRDYVDYNGRFFAPDSPFADRVRLLRSEGRAYLRNSDDRYDIIQMSGVDSFTALSTGAYTLSESYLYTVEAVREFWSHLNEGGYVNYSRFILDRPKKPRETMRLANIARAALEAEGVADPAASILVFQGVDWASTIIKRGPFTRAEVDALKALGDRNGYRGLVFDPLKSREEPFGPPSDHVASVRDYMSQALTQNVSDGLDELGGREAALDALTTAYRRWFAQDEAGAAAAIRAVTDRVADAEKRSGLNSIFLSITSQSVDYLKSLHAPFLKTRRDFEILLRGSSAERDRFVADYEYRLRPCTDDDPFFFNYYRWRGVFAGTSDQGQSSELQARYHPDIPIGHFILLASLVQILLLAGVMIIWPLRRLAKEGVRAPGAFNYLTYFSALGLGFMFVEIALMQKLVIFLGHPTYALSVVLSSLLGFAGLGSFLAGRFRRIGRAQLFLLLTCILAAIALSVGAADWLLPRLLGQSFAMRVATTVALLLPIGLALGTAFPSGLRVVAANCPQLLPWAWAINGFLSVAASILCIVLSQELGFRRVLWIAAAIYFVGFLFMKPERPQPARDAAVEPAR